MQMLLTIIDFSLKDLDQYIEIGHRPSILSMMERKMKETKSPLFARVKPNQLLSIF
jgi:hypothetical protein